MIRRRRGHECLRDLQPLASKDNLKNPQPAASKLNQSGNEAQAARREVEPGKASDGEFFSHPIKPVSTAAHALPARLRVKREGHEFRDSVVKGNARAHFGDVYNIHPMAATVPDDEGYEGLAFEGMASHLKTISPSHAETCKWLLDRQEYVNWQDPALRILHHGVLWVKGKAGTGKSVLMRFIHDHTKTRDDGEIVVSFFFNARSSNTLAKSVEGMYRSLLFQMLNEFAVRGIALSHIHDLKPEEQGWSLALLRNALRDAIMLLPGGERVTWFIDALDECDRDDLRTTISSPFRPLTKPIFR